MADGLMNGWMAWRVIGKTISSTRFFLEWRIDWKLTEWMERGVSFIWIPFVFRLGMTGRLRGEGNGDGDGEEK